MAEEKQQSDATTAINPISGRELPEANIYEAEDFRNEAVNENLANLQKELTESLKDRNNIKGQIIAYNRLGTAFYRLFRFDKAEICFIYQFQLAQPMEAPLPFQAVRERDPLEEKNALVNLGCIYRIRRLYELSLNTFRLALDITEELEDKRSKARILNNISNVYEEVLDIESATDCQLKRMELVSDLCDVDGQIKCAASLGSFYQLTGDIRESIMYYEKAVINLRMKIVKGQLDALEEGQAENNPTEPALANDDPDVMESNVDAVVEEAGNTVPAENDGNES